MQMNGNKQRIDILIMLLIFILAGAFSQVARQAGCIESVVNLSLTALPSSFILAGLFIASCIVSLSIGTSCGTIAALVPIATGIAQQTNAETAMMVAIVVGGSLFGDNLSFISDTTIMATKTQGCQLADKFKQNIRIALPAAIITLVLYTVTGSGIESTGASHSINYVNTLPYLLIFVLALAGINVIHVLLIGLAYTSVSAWVQGVLSPAQIWDAMWVGTGGMHDLIVVTIIAAVIIDYLQRRGVIEWLTTHMGRYISTRRGAELSISASVVAADILTANNTIAILAIGPVARSLSYRYGIDPRRTASLLDTMSCFAQGLLPWGAQLLIAAGLAGINPIDIIPHLYYTFILGAITVASIFATFPRK